MPVGDYFRKKWFFIARFVNKWGMGPNWWQLQKENWNDQVLYFHTATAGHVIPMSSPCNGWPRPSWHRRPARQMGAPGIDGWD